LLYITVIQV